MTARPRLLMATHLVPIPVDMGCKVRMTQIAGYLRNHFDVTLVSLSQTDVSPDGLEGLKQICHRFQAVPAPNRKSLAHRGVYRVLTEALSLQGGVPSDFFYANVRAMKRTLQETLQDHGPFDVVLTQYWYASEYLSRIQGPLKVVDTHDVDHMKNEEIRRTLRDPWQRLVLWVKQRHNARRELEVLERYDLVLAVTDSDRETFRGLLGPSCEVLTLPIGVDTAYFRTSSPVKAPQRITFFGTLKAEGNVHATFFFYKEIFPRILREMPEAEFVIMGSYPPPEIQELFLKPNVHVTGFLPDIRPLLESSSVVVCPFRMGYGFRTRVLEPMALGVPVVSTTVGVEGVGLREGEGVLLRDTSEAFAQAVIRLLRDPIEAAAVGKRGRQVVEERFSVESIYGRFTETLLKRVREKQ